MLRVGAYIKLDDGNVGVLAQLEVGLGEARHANAELDIHGKQAAHHLACKRRTVRKMAEAAMTERGGSDRVKMRRGGQADGAMEDSKMR